MDMLSEKSNQVIEQLKQEIADKNSMKEYIEKGFLSQIHKLES